ncbi:MAG: two-component regulator propeller domain-containing protein, partial [Terriglobales bacterium]
MPTLILSILLFLAASAWAEGTRTWQQSRFEEFEKGTTRGVAIESQGALTPAPSFESITTTPSTFLWAAASDPQGNVYAAAGAPARVYRVDPSGEISVIFKPQELQVQALALGPGGVIFAATSPDGKVYRIARQKDSAAKGDKAAAEQKKEETRPTAEMPVDPSWTATEYFAPGTKYIWDLALDKDGRLYVATGDRGEIFRVTSAGQGALFFKSDEAHIRALVLDAAGNLIAGSDGNGLVYRISPAGEAFVLYSAPKKEITALAVDAAGNIYAAGLGEKRPALSGVSVPSPVPFATTVTSPALQQPGAPPPPVVTPMPAQAPTM